MDKRRRPLPLDIWFFLAGLIGLLAVVLLSACAMRYGDYTGALACVDITGPGFSWKCNEGSKVPTLPDPPQPGKP